MRPHLLSRLAVGVVALVNGQTPAGPPVSAGTQTQTRLTAPDDSDSFSFVVFGDRTGGPRSGVRILAEAVETAGWLDPDFVITVGDLVQGYNTPDEWLAEMQEYKSIMDTLAMPWYPVAGNHDVYARPSLPAGHTGLYKHHFGPLYYSFDHEFAHFIVLFSDESLAYHDPAENQNMSPEQLAWLRADLASTDAARVFVFLHHPRWLDQYAGGNWPAVERVFKQDGRPVTVVAGHIHAIRDDANSGNIRYLTVGSVGAHLERHLPHASFHHISLFHVRPDSQSLVHIPIGAIKPASAFPGWESDEIATLHRGDWARVGGNARIGPIPGEHAAVTVTLTNPTRKTLDIYLAWDTPEGWTVSSPRPGPIDRVPLAPGQTVEWAFDLAAPALGQDRPRLFVRVRAVYPLGSGEAQPVSLALPVTVNPVLAPARQVPDQPAPAPNGVLKLDGRSAVIAVMPEKPQHFTLEAWVRGTTPSGRQGLLSNTESSGLGIFWSDAKASATLPTGYVHVGGSYTAAETSRPWDWARWTHLALSYDGAHLRMFVNGVMTDERAAPGPINHNRLPLIIGADVNAQAKPTSFWTGELDEARLSDVARYTADFTPSRRHIPDAHTVLLFRFDEDLGPVFRDASAHEAHAWSTGSPEIIRAALPD